MSSITVSNLSPETSEKELHDFLSFCGKIDQLNLKGDKAEVRFAKISASKTALLLDGTSLGNREIHVTADTTTDTASDAHAEEEREELTQEDKPRSRILAEYLASGYKLGNHVLQRGLQYDQENGLSKRFTDALKQVDQKVSASQKLQQIDNTYSISNKAQQGAHTAWQGISSYYEKFAATDSGSKLVEFYKKQNQQVNDIHQEALRLSGLKNNSSGVHPAEVVGEDQHGVKKTHCSCGGSSGNCGCKVGECTCSGCQKAEAKSVDAGHQTATGEADAVAEKTNIEPLANQKN